MSKTKVKTRKSDFSCRAPVAEAVFLAGTFNDWRADATPMEKNSEGEWTTSLDLEPGRYEFKFVVDGEWVCEENGLSLVQRPKESTQPIRVLRSTRAWTR